MATPPSPDLSTLDARAREIFREIVESYLTTGEPVGSRTLSKLGGVGLSPASIRNTMADLAGLGLLEAPHAMAGRRHGDDALRDLAQRPRACACDSCAGTDQRVHDRAPRLLVRVSKASAVARAGNAGHGIPQSRHDSLRAVLRGVCRVIRRHRTTRAPSKGTTPCLTRNVGPRSHGPKRPLAAYWPRKFSFIRRICATRPIAGPTGPGTHTRPGISAPDACRRLFPEPVGASSQQPVPRCVGALGVRSGYGK